MAKMVVLLVVELVVAVAVREVVVGKRADNTADMIGLDKVSNLS